MRKFFGILKLILSLLFLLLTIATVNYYLNFQEREEVDNIPLLNVQATYAIVSCLYLLFSAYLCFSAVIELKQRQVKQKMIIWVGIALGLTFVVSTFLISTTANIIFAVIVLIISARDLVFVNRK